MYLAAIIYKYLFDKKKLIKKNKNNVLFTFLRYYFPAATRPLCLSLCAFQIYRILRKLWIKSDPITLISAIVIIFFDRNYIFSKIFCSSWISSLKITSEKQESFKISSKSPEAVKCVSGGQRLVYRQWDAYYRGSLIIGYSGTTAPAHWGPRSRWAACSLQGRPA